MSDEQQVEKVETKTTNASLQADLQEMAAKASWGFGDLRVIWNYIVAEQQRKASSLKIGIFTVFLVVMIITMLESIVAVTPILFVKMGQDNAGAIDVKLTYK